MNLIKARHTFSAFFRWQTPVLLSLRLNASEARGPPWHSFHHVSELQRGPEWEKTVAILSSPFILWNTVSSISPSVLRNCVTAHRLSDESLIIERDSWHSQPEVGSALCNTVGDLTNYPFLTAMHSSPSWSNTGLWSYILHPDLGSTRANMEGKQHGGTHIWPPTLPVIRLQWSSLH